jgi:heat shock protein beta
VPHILSLLVSETWHRVSVVSMYFQISKATVSERLSDSPCALVAGVFGWTGNMERLAISNAHQKSDDPQRSFYLNQKKTMEINPRHPLIKELLRRVQDNTSDPTAKDIAVMMFQTGMSYCDFLKHKIDYLGMLLS